MMLKKYSSIFLILGLFFCLAMLSGCSPRGAARLEKHSEARTLMGTTVQLDVCRDQISAKEIEEVYQAVWARLETIAWKMNVFDGRSDVSKVNTSNLKLTVIGADAYRVIRSAQRYSKATDGAFDITVWPLIDFWRQKQKDDHIPTAEQIDTVLSAVGFKNIQLLAGGRVRLLNKDTKIDLGGIAKGYAVDEAARIFREHGVGNFYIDAGGDIYVGGVNCAGELWRIGIRDPQDTSKMVDVVAVSDKAVMTSGDYERFYEIQGQRWSHILNPITGYPQKGVISATVIASSAMEADALATALCVLGGEAGTDYINTLSESHASLILSARRSQAVERFASQEYENFQYKK